ncbi:hypothetical protein [Streptomyces kebangsaanensis]|uniref:hypothetical protein n=1 Tax=Streptomyces kebangsaanensis TaxID=864058 RepID=UPI00093A0E39|nr:hypothetical protein [Streptomyces kebangsaanensis]
MERAGTPLRRVGQSLAVPLALLLTAPLATACGNESADPTAATIRKDIVDTVAAAGLTRMGEPTSEKDCATGVMARRQGTEGERADDVVGILRSKGWTGDQSLSLEGREQTLLTKQGWELRVRAYDGEGEVAGLVALIASRSGCELS